MSGKKPYIDRKTARLMQQKAVALEKAERRGQRQLAKKLRSELQAMADAQSSNEKPRSTKAVRAAQRGGAKVAGAGKQVARRAGKRVADKTGDAYEKSREATLKRLGMKNTCYCGRRGSHHRTCVMRKVLDNPKEYKSIHDTGDPGDPERFYGKGIMG